MRETFSRKGELKYVKKQVLLTNTQNNINYNPTKKHRLHIGFIWNFQRSIHSKKFGYLVSILRWYLFADMTKSLGNIRIGLSFYTILNYQYLKFSVAQIISCFKIESFVPALYFLLLHITKSHGNRCSNLFLRWPKVRLASLDFRRLKSGQQYLKTQMCLSETTQQSF